MTARTMARKQAPQPSTVVSVLHGRAGVVSLAPSRVDVGGATERGELPRCPAVRAGGIQAAQGCAEDVSRSVVAIFAPTFLY